MHNPGTSRPAYNDVFEMTKYPPFAKNLWADVKHWFVMIWHRLDMAKRVLFKNDGLILVQLPHEELLQLLKGEKFTITYSYIKMQPYINAVVLKQMAGETDEVNMILKKLNLRPFRKNIIKVVNHEARLHKINQDKSRMAGKGAVFGWGVYSGVLHAKFVLEA